MDENPKPEIDGLTLVFIGSMNPPIFHPSWLAARGLIPEAEAEAAKVDLINSDLAQFSLDWMQFQALRDRVILTTIQAPAHEPMRDLAIGLFRILKYTPIKMVGLNREGHFRCESQESWHEVGHLLAPKQRWTPILKSPGMQSLTIKGLREDGRKGAVNVTVEPSVRVQPGIFIRLNDHIDFPEAEENEVTNTIEQAWKPFREKAGKVFSAVLGPEPK